MVNCSSKAANRHQTRQESLPFMKPEDSSACSQDSVTGPDPEPD
jgi:hypothetical protein